MVKIIFSDFDETMLNYCGGKNDFNDYQLNILKKIKSKGIRFCIVTGRNVDFFYQFSNILPYVDYIISSNGSCIFDLSNSEFIYTKYIGEQEVVNLFDYIHEHKMDMFYNSLGKQIYNEEVVNLKTCEQIILSFNDSCLEDVLRDIRNIPYVSYNNICRHGDRYTIDVNDSSVSKGNAVKYLCNYLDVDVDDTIGFGDSDNDVSMFQVVGKSISVKNGTERIKTLADDVSLASDEDGIFRYIDKFILK